MLEALGLAERPYKKHQYIGKPSPPALVLKLKQGRAHHYQGEVSEYQLALNQANEVESSADCKI